MHVFLATVFPEDLMNAKRSSNNRLFQVLNQRFGLIKTNTTNRQAVNLQVPSKHEVGHTTEYRNLAFRAPVKNLLDLPAPDATKSDKEQHEMAVLIHRHAQTARAYTFWTRLWISISAIACLSLCTSSPQVYFVTLAVNTDQRNAPS